MGRQLADAIAKHQWIGIDTGVFIYHLELHPIYSPLTTTALNMVQTAQVQGVASVVALMEIVGKPLSLNQPDIADLYEILLRHFPNLYLLEVDDRIARQAAELRVKYRLKIPDALHVATALRANATAFITNDEQLKRITELDVIGLNDFLPNRH